MRRTKEEAARTRQKIMASALRAFSRKGISRTTLEHIAKGAGVTRGAIYWHFRGKRALFRAIRDAVSLPLLDQGDLTLLRGCDDDPLDRVERFLADLAAAVERDRVLRMTFDVMSFKCEYVGDLAVERQALVRNTHRLRSALERAYLAARDQGMLREGLTPRIAALETIAFLSGLMRLLLLDSARTGLMSDARAVIRAHVASRREHDSERDIVESSRGMFAALSKSGQRRSLAALRRRPPA